MNTKIKKSGFSNMKVRLSTLWIFVMLNYLYADVLTLMDKTTLTEILAGKAGEMEITQGFLLGAAVLMETAIVMVLLARVLNYKANRIANIISGILHTLAVTLSLLVGEPAAFYLFFSVIEIVTTLFIVWYAWRWRETKTI